MPVYVLRAGATRAAPPDRRESDRPRSLAATFRNGEPRVVAFEARRDADEFARCAGGAVGEVMHVERTTLAKIALSMGAARVGVDLCSTIPPPRPHRELDGVGAGGARIRVERALVVACKDPIAAARNKLELDALATDAWFESVDDT